VWRAVRDRVLVRRVGADDAAELMGLAALVWVAADVPSTMNDLVRELGSDAGSVSEAVSLLLSSEWLVEASR
jgi:hypothetical protein